MLSVFNGKNGYPTVSLYKDGKHRGGVAIHALMAAAFIGPRPNGYYVCHGDGIRTNNVIWNLRYASPKDNYADAVNHGSAVRGERHGQSKLDCESVMNIKGRIGNGESPTAIARDFGVAKSTVFDIKFGRCWS